MSATADATVVVCTRNRADMLERALASIAAATPDDVDVLVVDSASSDWATRDVARSAGVRYVRTDVKGLSIARNLGLASTERPIVVFTDDDCAAVDGWIEHLVAVFDDPRVGAATGLLLDHTRIGEAVDETPRRYTEVRRGLDAGHGALMAFRRELLVELGGFDDVLGAGRRLAGAEDLDMFCRVLAADSTIVAEPRSVIHHLNTRDEVAYTELHRGYGRGLGGLAAKWLRLRPALGISMTTTILGRSVVHTVRRFGSARRRRAETALMSGFMDGLVRSWRVPLDGSRFVDTTPPEPTPVADGPIEAK